MPSLREDRQGGLTVRAGPRADVHTMSQMARDRGRARASAQLSTGRSGSEPSQPSAPPLTISKKPRRPSPSTWISMTPPPSWATTWGSLYSRGTRPSEAQ
jgi:hypothetical protein